jgi:glyoxylase-like metal-dependent hydrolase (beta-lactamase superfamily II)
MRPFLRWLPRVVLGVLALGLATLVLVLRSKRSGTSEVELVAPGIYHVRNFLADVYASRVEDGVILFDAGMDPEGRAIDDVLAELHASRAQVRHVFLTHGHFDHVAAAGLYPNAVVHIGSGDSAVLAQREAARPLTPRLWGALIGAGPLEVKSPLRGTERIRVGNAESVLALPFPGHTPGSFVFLFHGVLFTGDSIQLEHGQLTPANPNFSVDPAQNQASIHALAKQLDGERVDFVCTGHMWCTTPGSAAELLQRLSAN